MALTEDENERLTTILGALSERMAKLNDRARSFVADQQKRYDEWGSNMRLSPKQWAWLENLYSEHCE